MDQNNIPAFPRPLSVSPKSLESNQQVLHGQEGMTLLDYFASHVAPSVIKRYGLLYSIPEVSDDENNKALDVRRRFIATESYALAKAFLDIRGEFDKDKK
jgi:hypothetical protein